MKKFLYSDWLRAVQFFSKTVQKRVNSVQKEVTNQAFCLVCYLRELKHATFFSHGRHPELNISHAWAVVVPRFSN